jgi:MFS family permease
MSLSMFTTDQRVPELTRARTFAMAVCAGIAVANIYYNQPLLGLIEADYPNSSAIGLIPTATQFGYAVGLLFLVPLGDLVERRRLISVQFIVLAAALAFAAIAPSTLALIAASLMLGVRICHGSAFVAMGLRLRQRACFCSYRRFCLGPARHHITDATVNGSILEVARHAHRRRRRFSCRTVHGNAARPRRT